MDNEQPHQELVKCVVVGDTAVGKTRLICARACNTRVSLHQLMTTHIPTVWAIDQYRIYKEVLQRSWEVVDGVSVSLRLWDTFGDHDKDRRFAYGRSDVVLLCFSIANPLSLRNAKVVWYPEIRKFCPSTPIVLVGCKNDLRFMYMDETFVSIVNERRSFVKPIKESDIISPEQCRAVAKEIGAPYYETSVLTYYGVEEVFENVIRAALIARRHARFWMTNLKKVQKPLLQYPFLPPKPQAPDILVPPSQLEEDLRALLHNQAYCDVLFVAGNVAIAAHKVVLAIASQTFLDILMTDLSVEPIQRQDSDCSTSVSLGLFNPDTEKLIVDDSESSQDNSPLHKPPPPSASTPERNLEKFFSQLEHTIFSSLHLQEIVLGDQSKKTSMQLIVTLHDDVYPAAFEQCMKYLYCGTFDFWATDLDKVRKVAENLLITDIVNMIDNVRRGEEFMNDEIRNKFFTNRVSRIRELCLQKGIFSDVVFQLDDGTLSVHKPLLMARCDVMFAMFSGDFLESSAKVIPMPGVNKECFKFLLEYLYTDMCPSIKDVDCLEIIELANRLCLPRLVAMVEQSVVDELTKSIDSDADVAEDVLLLLEPAQLHNAKQLSTWCLNYIAANYNEVCKKLSKLLKNLHSDNQVYLLRHRWPPVWYLKEYDLYEKGLIEREKEEQPLKLLKRHRNSGGCLCFTSKSRRNTDKTDYYSV